MTATPETRARITQILAAQALRDPQELTPQTTLDALGIDSLGMAEILFAIEEGFDITVPFNANTPEAAGLDLESVGGICDGVQRLIDAKQG
ncbi:acyl carrier protein [Pararhodobacter oceanensis]|uniref:Phosphopantetheine-binding protein n=1 Tax=Pararhodobacter oceanensis TaxID=2172121 RepID=A0A2T8HYU9_9RHOB|nr:acyl carrier protein [Pararhodobacter oceanensis]PVH30522.1 phosphopantetheine-binding protein [Pararhodobacter oceanensis]